MSLGAFNEYSVFRIYHRKCSEDEEKLSESVLPFQVKPVALNSWSHFHLRVGISNEHYFAPLLKKSPETVFHFSSGQHSASLYFFLSWDPRGKENVASELALFLILLLLLHRAPELILNITCSFGMSNSDTSVAQQPPTSKKDVMTELWPWNQFESLHFYSMYFLFLKFSSLWSPLFWGI